MWQVQVTGPLVVPQTHRLDPGATWVVGRGEGADLVLPSDCVSRRHALVTVTESGPRIADLGSRNGTLLNGRPVGSVSRDVQPGDVVGVGNYVLKFEPRGEVRPLRRAGEGFVTLRSGAFDQNPFSTRVDVRPPAELQPSEPGYGALLFQLAERLARGIEVDAFLREVLATARAVTGFEGGVLLGSSVKELEPLGDIQLECSSTIVEAAIARRSALLAAHVRTEDGFNESESVILSGHLHVLCAPFLEGEAVLGALYLYTRGAPPPTQGTVEFIGSLARLAAAALERQRAAEATSTLHAFPLRRLGDTAEFLSGIITELSRLLVAPGPEPKVIDGDQASELRDLLEEARTAARQLSVELNPAPLTGARDEAA